MNVTTASDGLKKVMRIALVGIKPADQVMLKGYLRILLRLEADLEWVSANTQQVDLFMVNHDFRYAESVVKLINNNPNTATIFTAHSETEQGYLTEDLLVLPLKDLALLSHWLFSKVPFLASTPGTSTTPTTAEVMAKANNTTLPAIAVAPTANHTIDKPSHLSTPQTSGSDQSIQPLISTINNTHNAHDKFTEVHSSPLTPATTNTDQIPTASYDYLLGFAKIFSQIQQRQNELLAITSPAGILFAYINPKQQRVWELTAYVSSNQPWIVAHADDSVKNHLDVKAANNLVQWLWELSGRYGQKLEALLDPQIKYHIESWVKPLHDADQHDYLKIQCVLEARSVTIDELVALSQCALPQVKKTLVGLFVAGAFPTSVYQQTISRLSSQLASAVSPPVTQTQQATIPNVTPIQSLNTEKPTTLASPQSKLDELLNQRSTVSGISGSSSEPNTLCTSNHKTLNNSQMGAEQPTVPTSSVSKSATTPPQSTPPILTGTQDTSDHGMMGFLSRLRRRLGL